jgi:transcriptional regulator EpsA
LPKIINQSEKGDCVFGSNRGGNASSVVFTNLKTVKKYARFCANGLDVKTIDDFTAWLKEDLKPLFPHEAFSCGWSNFEPGGLIPMQLINIDFPIEYLTAIKNDGGFLTSPVIARWFREREPQLFDLSHAKEYPEEWLANFEHYDLKNIASHGIVDIDGRAATYFGFHRIPSRVGKLHSDMLKLLVPHVHQAFTKLVRSLQEIARTAVSFGHTLTKRELEILHWIAKGKSNWEIAAITDSSLAMVKHDVSNMLAKLGVRTRVQAVARAVSLDLNIDPL